MAVEKTNSSSSLAEVIDRILDKGIVIDAWARVSLVGIELLAIEAWADANGISDAYDTKIKSPAQMEKVLKKHGKELPSDLVTTVSSGSTLAVESDPRPAVLQIGKQLTAALSKL